MPVTVQGGRRYDQLYFDGRVVFVFFFQMGSYTPVWSTLKNEVGTCLALCSTTAIFISPCDVNRKYIIRQELPLESEMEFMCMCVCAYERVVVGFMWKPSVAKNIVSFSPLKTEFPCWKVWGRTLSLHFLVLRFFFTLIEWSEKLVLFIYLQRDSFYFLKSLGSEVCV